MSRFSCIIMLFAYFCTKFIQAAQNCSSDWLPFNGSCFRIFTNNSITMQNSRQTCYDNEADLASIHSADENAFLINLLGPPSNASAPSVFFIGLFVSRQFIGIQTETLWSDGSPVDFFNGPDDSLLDHTWDDGHFYWPKIAENITSIGNCVLMGQGRRRWMDTRCDTPAQGFICKKVLPRSSQIMSYGYTMMAFSVLCLCSQAYVIWLIIAKSPEVMKNYRFYLCGTTGFDAVASFGLGILMVPDIWQPYALACSINGLAKYLGAEGGRISLCIVEFAVIGQVFFQLLSLLFRYASVMERQHTHFHRLLTNKWSPLVQIGVLCSLAAFLVFVTFSVMDNPKDLPGYMWPLYNGVSQKFYSDAVLANLPMITLNPYKILQVFSIFSGAFCFFYPFSIFLNIRIILYLRANAKLFSKRTFQLQVQLIISLMVQLILPILFIGFPVLAAFLITLFASPISKSTAQLGVFLFELYALINPLTVVLFVSPFRRHTARICGINALRKKFFGATTDTTTFGNQMVTTIVPDGQRSTSSSKGQNIQNQQKRQNFQTRGRIQSAAIPMSNSEGETIREITPQKRSMSLKF